jgi:hypothetical protein
MGWIAIISYKSIYGFKKFYGHVKIKEPPNIQNNITLHTSRK